jgi:hypothetical protein
VQVECHQTTLKRHKKKKEKERKRKRKAKTPMKWNYDECEGSTKAQQKKIEGKRYSL